MSDLVDEPFRSARDVLDLALHRAQVKRHSKVGQLYVASLRREDASRLKMHDDAPVQVI
jgi:hypothetical protein